MSKRESYTRPARWARRMRRGDYVGLCLAANIRPTSQIQTCIREAAALGIPPQTTIAAIKQFTGSHHA